MWYSPSVDIVVLFVIAILRSVQDHLQPGVRCKLSAVTTAMFEYKFMWAPCPRWFVKKKNYAVSSTYLSGLVLLFLTMLDQNLGAGGQDKESVT